MKGRASYAERRRMKAAESGEDFPEVDEVVEELRRASEEELPDPDGDEPMPFNEPDDAEEFNPDDVLGGDELPEAPTLATKKKSDKPGYVYQPEKAKRKKPPSDTWNV